jgi:hypothetical protein
MTDVNAFIKQHEKEYQAFFIRNSNQDEGVTRAFSPYVFIIFFSSFASQQKGIPVIPQPPGSTTEELNE